MHAKLWNMWIILFTFVVKLLLFKHVIHFLFCMGLSNWVKVCSIELFSVFVEFVFFLLL